MNVLQKKPGTFIFLVDGYSVKEFNDYDEVPKDLNIKEIICFLPDIPPPPHTVQQHEEIHVWSELFNELMEKERASSN